MEPLLAKNLAPIAKYFRTKGLIEVCVNQPGQVWLQTYDGWKNKKDKEITVSQLTNFCKILATTKGQRFSDESPILATSLPEYGYRVQAMGGAITAHGFALSIRVAAAQRFELDTYFQPEDCKEVVQALQEGKTMLVAGGTASGKTTLLNSMIAHIPEDVRIITVEDAQELELPHPNVVRIVKSKSGTDVAKIQDVDIINSVVRMNPDRVLMGELDVGNTFPFFRLSNTGHSGSMATVHANGPQETLDAVAMNAELAGYNPDAARKYALQGLDYIVFIKRYGPKDYRAQLVRRTDLD